MSFCRIASLYCGLRIVWANIFRERNPQSAIRNPQWLGYRHPASELTARAGPLTLSTRQAPTHTTRRRQALGDEERKMIFWILGAAAVLFGAVAVAAAAVVLHRGNWNLLLLRPPRRGKRAGEVSKLFAMESFD